MRTMDKAIEEKLLSSLRGAVCFPDDVHTVMMPLIREAIEEQHQESMRQMSIAALDGNRYEGKSSMPAGLLRFARTKAMARVHELRREGFGDPVDMLLAIACETDDEGEWKHSMEIRLQCLTNAAPYCRPKLQAIIAKLMDAGKSHAEWLLELKEEIDGAGNGVIDGQSKEIN